MNNQNQHYRIRIRGFLDESWDQYFPGFTLSKDTDPEQRSLTSITGLIKDQAHLYGIISKMRDLGFVLVDINQIHREK